MEHGHAVSRRSALRLGLGAAGATLLPGVAGCATAAMPGGAASSGASGSSAPGVASQGGEPAVPGSVHDAEQAAQVALAMARLAASAQTFAVGGAIIENSSGRVIHALQNRVLQDLGTGLGPLSDTPYTQDPTAHGERQLVYWYFANRESGLLPPPQELTVVTSLDPCAMCAGSLTSAGFHTAVVALDDFAGVNFNGKTDFAGYPTGVGDALRGTFGYYGVDGGRAFAGAPNTLFASTAVTATTAAACGDVFGSTADGVRAASSGSGLDPANPDNNMSDPANSSIRGPYSLSFPDAFTIRLADYRRPDAVLRDYLTGLVERTPGARNAVALIDFYGNLLMASADRFDINPIATAFMTTTQEYARLRFALVDDPVTSAVAQRTLTSPAHGTFVLLHALDGVSTLGLKDLGAYGSSMEGKIPVTQPSNFQYFEGPLQGTVADLTALIAAMPPFYTKLVGIDPQQVVLD
ncbi:MAG: nucleoside deaminase [Actinobacteria bacterium]|nr:MAG: nucleoside deaminase [Actinomycetota bacterium]